MGMAFVLAFGFGTSEILIILAVILLFFGAKRIPDLARGLGKSVSEFKKGKDEPTGDDTPKSDKTSV
jgi:sec-independent protein translocase protein TatA